MQNLVNAHKQHLDSEMRNLVGAIRQSGGFQGGDTLNDRSEGMGLLMNCASADMGFHENREMRAQTATVNQARLVDKVSLNS